MIQYIDTDLNQAIQAPGARSPANANQLKIYDTPGLDFYLSEQGNNQDFGSGTSFRFGLNLAAPAPISLLVEETTFNRTVDADGNVFYHGLPNFDTTQLLAALSLGGSPLNCAGELRYQKPTGEICRTLDIPFQIYRAILSEVTTDTLAADFTVPAIGSNVPIVIGDTGWLTAGKLLSIATAGVYQVASITNATTFEGTNTGQSGNAAAAAVISHPQVVSSTSPTVPATYPDVSLILLRSSIGVASGVAPLDSDGFLFLAQIPAGVEKTANKNAAGGYSGLDSQSLLSALQIPADGSTVVVTPSIITRTGTTTIGSAVVTGLSATSDLTLNEPVTGTGIPGATTLLSIDSPSQITLSANATAAGTVPLTFTTQKLSAVGPAQGVISITQSNFMVPAVGDNVTINAPTGGLTVGNTYNISGGAGTYVLADIIDINHADYTNAGGSTNAAPGTVINWPVNITWSGPQGPRGPGIGVKTTAACTLPSSYATPVTITTEYTAGMPFAGGLYIIPSAFALMTGTASGGTLTLQFSDQYQALVAFGTALPIGTLIIFVGYATLAAGTGTDGATLLTDATLSDTQPYPQVKRLKSADASVVIGTGDDSALDLAAVSKPYSIPGFYETPAAETYTVDLAAASAYKIAKITIKLASGTCTAALNRNGAGITGATAIAVTSTLQAIVLSQVVAVDDLIELVVSSPSSAVQLSYAVRINP